MRILVLGAGGVGGYFGGRMAQAGSDVTFLVREARAAQLRDGLRIESPHGDATIQVNAITGNDVSKATDVIIMSCKAYSLGSALDTIAPFVTNGTPILPLLNGYRHIERIQERFPTATVWGGTANIVATLTPDGAVRQMNTIQAIAAGVRKGQSESHRVLEKLIAELQRAGITALVRPDIELDMWEKWTFLTTLAASTCLMRGSIGQILATDYGERLIAGLFDECIRTATAGGRPPGANPTQDYRGALFDRSATYTASMMRDMESGAPTEAEHIIGDMITRAHRHGIQTPLLETAYSRLQVYERQRLG